MTYRGGRMDILKKVNAVMNHRQKITLMVLIIAGIIGSIFELVGVALIMPFVSVISDTSKIFSSNIYRNIYYFLNLKEEKSFILLFAFGIIFVYIFKNAYIIIYNAILIKFIAKNQKKLQMHMIEYYMNQSYLFHASKNISEITRSVDSDVKMFFTTIQAILQLLNEAMISALIVVYLLILDKSITIGVIIVLSVFSLAFVKLVKSKIMSYGNKYHTLTAVILKWIRQSFEGIKEIKIANSEQYYINQVDRYSDDLIKATILYQVINGIPKPLFEMVCISAMMLVVILKIIKGVDLSYFIPVLSAFAIAAFRLLPSFGRFTNFYNVILYNKIGVDEVYSDIFSINNNSDNEDKKEDKYRIEFNDEIRINEVSFAYPRSNKLVLSNISLEIRKNTSAALIGQSGAGKTTLVDIILGLMKPQKGEITVDGYDIYGSIDSWHSIIGYIPQNIYLIDDSIKNNIVFGIPEKDISDDRIWSAINDAQLKEFVEGLPNGIDTIVGERGVRLSGGQRQRIGIARALYNNPELLVLDEATSALDNETEAAVMEAIDRLKGSKTMIIIAHRLTTIRNCDYIYEISNDGIVSKEKKEIFG